MKMEKLCTPGSEQSLHECVEQNEEVMSLFQTAYILQEMLR